MKKKTWIITIIAFFVVAGGASAFFLLNKTAKEQYFHAEIKTIQHIEELVESRFENETEWVKKSGTKAIDSTYELSGEYIGDTNPEIQQLLSNSSVAIRMASDPKEKEVEAELNATILGVEIEPIKSYITTEKVILDLPFYDQLLQLKDKDFGKLMLTFDPTYSGSEDLGLENLLGQNGTLSEENMEYLKDEYIMELYESLPEESFTTSDETIDVNGKSLKTEKVTMKLSEAEVKTILTDILQKAKKDSKFKTIVEDSTQDFVDQYNSASGSAEPMEFDTVMDDLISEVDNIKLPNGINSTIWHDADIIVKREFDLGISETEKLEIVGSQSLDASEQNWDYTFNMANESLNFTGDLSTKDGTSTDVLAFSFNDEEVFVYNGEEKVLDGDRTFERKFILQDEFEPMELSWNGSSSHKKDAMQAEHELSFEMPNSSSAIIHVNEERKIIKNVKLPAESEKIVDIGAMDADSLEQLMAEDIFPAMEQWGMNIAEQFEQELY